MGELDPHGVFRFHRSLAGKYRTSVTNDVREVQVGLDHGRVTHESRRGCDAGWGARIEEHRARGGVAVAAILFRDEADHRQVVAKNAYAALGSRAATRECNDAPWTFAQCAEQIQFNCRTQRCRALVSRQGVEYKRGRRLCRCLGPGCQGLPPYKWKSLDSQRATRPSSAFDHGFIRADAEVVMRVAHRPTVGSLAGREDICLFPVI